MEATPTRSSVVSGFSLEDRGGKLTCFVNPRDVAPAPGDVEAPPRDSPTRLTARWPPSPASRRRSPRVYRDAVASASRRALAKLAPRRARRVARDVRGIVGYPLGLVVPVVPWRAHRAAAPDVSAIAQIEGASATTTIPSSSFLPSTPSSSPSSSTSSTTHGQGRGDRDAQDARGRTPGADPDQARDGRLLRWRCPSSSRRCTRARPRRWRTRHRGAGGCQGSGVLGQGDGRRRVHGTRRSWALVRDEGRRIDGAVHVLELLALEQRLALTEVRTRSIDGRAAHLEVAHR